MASFNYNYLNISLKTVKGEIYHDIPGLESIYQVSNCGNVTVLIPHFTLNLCKRILGQDSIFLKGLRLLIQKDRLQIKGVDTKKIIEDAGYKKWKVHAKSPFGNVASVVEYLGRYTHKIAITTQRIISISEDSVRFKYKDYADGDKQKEMTLTIGEFLRRFELHILPRRFVKIRHYGLLQNHGKIKRLNIIRQELSLSPLPPKVLVPVSQRMLEKYGKDITLCPKCDKGKLVWICTTYAKQDSNILRKTTDRNAGMPLILNNKGIALNQYRASGKKVLIMAKQNLETVNMGRGNSIHI